MRSDYHHGSQEFSDLGSQDLGCQDLRISDVRIDLADLGLTSDYVLSVKPFLVLSLRPVKAPVAGLGLGYGIQ